jgi:hypothetical protein
MGSLFSGKSIGLAVSVALGVILATVVSNMIWKKA